MKPRTYQLFEKKFKILALALLVGFCLLAADTVCAEPIGNANATILGPNVYVFNTNMANSDIQNVCTTVYNQMETAQFVSQGYALLFKPGTYSVDCNVGFYTQVAGLGQNPDDVLINGGVNVNARWYNGEALNNFWRTEENFAVLPTASDTNTDTTPGVTRIAVSQASPMRRLHIEGELALFDLWPSCNCGDGYASGGFLGDSKVDGLVDSGSQQQWLSRNSTWANWGGGAWNMVFVGCQNAPANTFPNSPNTTVATTPVMREKPYLYVDGSGNFAVFVPSLQTYTVGTTWANGSTPGMSIPISQFYIAQPATDTAASLNAALTAGKNIIFTPGTYSLNGTLQVNNPNTILLGLGVPSLRALTGLPVLSVADVDGVTIAGLIIDAGPVDSPVLLQVGPAGSLADHSANPTFLYDLTVRTGGWGAAKNDVGVVINSGNVVTDDIWIWRADHSYGVGWTSNPTKNGLIVNGNNVTCYGLFNEHHEQYQTIWNGNGGQVYMYQSEIPYDIPNQASWMNGSVDGYASYKVADNVTSHEAWGVGIYCYFRDAVATLNSAIEAPNNTGVNFHDLTTVWLNGQSGSQITHIINNIGAAATTSSTRQTLIGFIGSGSVSNQLASPTILTVTTNYGQVSLTWSAVSGATSYNIKRSTASYAESTIASTASTSYTDTSVVGGITYYYKVSGTNYSGEGPLSAEVTATPHSPAVLYQEDWGTTNGGTNVSAPSSVGWNQVLATNFYSGFYQASGAVDDTTGAGLPTNSMWFGDNNLGVAMFYTINGAGSGTYGDSAFTSIDPTLYTNLDLSVYAQWGWNGGALQSWFAVQVGGAWYVSTNHPIIPNHNQTGGTNYHRTDMIYSPAATNWNSLTVSSSVAIGGPAAATLSGPIAGIGLVAQSTGGWWNINELQITSATNAPTSLGSIAAGIIGGNSLTFNWTAGANVHLQSATNLAPPVVWSDVPNTTGQGSAVIGTTNTQMFFRLIQP